jgi:O-antigen ligase
MATGLVGTRFPSGRARADTRPAPFDLPERLFVAASFLAPRNLFVLRSLTVFDIAVVVIAFLMVAGRRRLQPLPRAVAVSGWVFLLAALVSTFRATLPGEAFTQTAQFAFAWFVLLPVVLTLARSRRVLRWSLLMLVAGSFTTVALAMISPTAQGADRILLFFSDNPNRLGYPGAYLLPFVACFLGRWWRTGRRALALAVALPVVYLTLWALAASASRGATVGLIVAVTVYFVLRPHVGAGVSAARLLLTGIVTAAAVFLLTRSGLFPFTLGERISRTFDSAERASLIDDRARLASAGLRAFRDSPFVGTGLDNFRHLAPLYAEGTTLQAPHNLWIQFLAQVGIVGTIAFAWFVVWWFAALLTAHRRALDPRDRDLTWAFVASMAAVMTIFMTTPILNDRHYWLLLGLGIALVTTPAKRTSRAAHAAGVP